MQIRPYLSFNGQCAEAFGFYQQVLGGTLELVRVSDTPMAADVPPGFDSDSIMHACLTIGDALLMASDAPSDMYEPAGGTSVSIHVDRTDEAERIFRELAEGGKVTMPIAETFWSPRFGMLVDRFGVPWMVNCAPVASTVG
jgi:PhnB protein